MKIKRKSIVMNSLIHVTLLLVRVNWVNITININIGFWLDIFADRVNWIGNKTGKLEWWITHQ